MCFGGLVIELQEVVWEEDRGDQLHIEGKIIFDCSSQSSAGRISIKNIIDITYGSPNKGNVVKNSITFWKLNEASRKRSPYPWSWRVEFSQ